MKFTIYYNVYPSKKATIVSMMKSIGGFALFVMGFNIPTFIYMIATETSSDNAGTFATLATIMTIVGIVAFVLFCIFANAEKINENYVKKQMQNQK